MFKRDKNFVLEASKAKSTQRGGGLLRISTVVCCVRCVVSEMGGGAGEEGSSNDKKKKSNGSVRSIFMHADAADLWLMLFGFLGALGDGFTMPVALYVTSEIMNNIGSSSTFSFSADAFVHKINQV